MFRQVVSTSKRAASTPLKTVTTATPAATRSFHSPFAVLSTASSPLTTPLDSAANAAAEAAAAAYEKQVDAAPEPHVTPTGTRTYVVSAPDPADSPYEVPSGAYPNSSPYVHTYPEDANGERQPQLSSSTSEHPAHPVTTRRVPINELGVGESAAVRFRAAPGAMGSRGGSEGGLGLMDKASTTHATEGSPPDVNPPPLSSESEKFSKLGVKDAWKTRK